MRICIFGNQDNAGYRICKSMREQGADAELLLMTHWESERSAPAAVDPQLAAGLPAWVKHFDNSPLAMVFGNPQAKRIAEDYDVVLAIGNMAMSMVHQVKGVPVVSLSTGPGNQGVLRIWDHYGLKYRVFWTTMRYYIRKGVRRCQRVLTHYDAEVYSLYKLGAMGKIQFYGMPEDVQGNRARVDQKLLAELNARYGQFDRVFLWLSRIDFKTPGPLMYKGTDKFIRAAARAIHEGANVRVVMGSHGRDAEAARELVQQLGIADHVDWVPHMPFWQLLTYLSISNAIVFDELMPYNAVSSGMFREALSVGAVLCRSYSEVMTRAGHGAGDCPVHHALTEDEVHAVMRSALAWTPQELRAEQAKSAAWAEQYLDSARQMQRLVGILQEVVCIQLTAARMSTHYELAMASTPAPTVNPLASGS